MTGADKRACIEDLACADQAEEAANKGEQGQVYKITKLVSGKYRGTTYTPIVDKQGTEGYSPRQQRRRQDGQSISAKF